MEENKKNKLYCQSCCANYSYCIHKNILMPYDRLAEVCPDFIPKDIYKGIDQAKCWKMRLIVDPTYKPLPDLWMGEYTRESLEEAKKYALKMMKKEAEL